jgi:hypothetical protein
MPRKPGQRCSLSWEQRVGTTLVGNLPQYKANQNLCNVNLSNITYPGLRASDFSVYHKKCPYASESFHHRVLDTDPSSPTYWTVVDLIGGEITSHADTKGIMVRESRGSKHGWLCVDDNCYYYTTNSQRYFYL